MPVSEEAQVITAIVSFMLVIVGVCALALRCCGRSTGCCCSPATIKQSDESDGDGGEAGEGGDAESREQLTPVALELE